ncbi:helix-turn-helix domain-containing protein [Kribbella sp. DT2]|uniref:TetR/AcrR family transcriptional regulator n=1 Tax=Kribbella sp. DT2 TaxID=3393427 RepID=UPI003CF600F1
MTRPAPDTATRAPTLRDRTRQLVAQEILDTALRLFTEQGYEETSIAQVAREAGVSDRTVFRYFRTKEDLLGGNQQEFSRVLAAAVRDQPAEADVWTALRAAIAAAQAMNESREQALERFRLLHGTAALRAGWLEKRLRLQEDLLPFVKARMGALGGNDHGARAVIATVFACLDTASTTWVAEHGKGEIMDLYDECIAAVRVPLD